MPRHEFEVDVRPHYLPRDSAPDEGRWAFAYTVTLTNRGDAPAQLIARHWIVRDARGQVQEVRGLGVVGRQPLIGPGESFSYTSGCQLRTASGSMQGSYLCVDEEGASFHCPIPAFVLQADDDGAHRARVLH